MAANSRKTLKLHGTHHYYPEFYWLCSVGNVKMADYLKQTNSPRSSQGAAERVHPRHSCGSVSVCAVAGQTDKTALLRLPSALPAEIQPASLAADDFHKYSHNAAHPGLARGILSNARCCKKCEMILEETCKVRIWNWNDLPQQQFLDFSIKFLKFQSYYIFMLLIWDKPTHFLKVKN